MLFFGRGVIGVMLAAIAATAAAGETLRLPELFSDGMVLQRERRVPVWGWAPAGQRVHVSIDKQHAEARADVAGRWRAWLPPLGPGGPFELTVTASGGEQRTIRNVLVGDVWFAAGQSNMEWGVGESANADAEVSAATDSEIRLFDITPRSSATPRTTTPGVQWEVCSPETIVRFSAVACYFGRELRRTQGVPIGLVNASVGGTAAELWTSREALATLPGFEERFLPPDQCQRWLDEDRDFKARFDWRDEGLLPGAEWWRPQTDDSAWECQVVPGAWEDNGLPDFDGMVWYRTRFAMPPDFARGGAMLELGRLGDNDQVWLNGQAVGSTERNGYRRRYTVPPGLLRLGGPENVLAVRIANRTGPGGFLGSREDLFLASAADPSARFSLADPAVTWRRAVGIDWRFTEPRPSRPSEDYLFSCLHNAMVAPVIPYGIRGVIWYQGEANAPRAHSYRQLFPALIGDWRGRWGDAKLPFFYVQLANYRREKDKPSEDPWAELREAQLLTLEVPHTAMASAIDIGDSGDIHPKNKQEVGRRLSLAARALVYGEAGLEYSGPLWRPGDMRREAPGRLRLRFDHAEGLSSRGGGKLLGFEVAGPDRRFHRAEATIDAADRAVIVGSPAVPVPVAVRYAWAVNPRATLINAAGLPASPFRTDHWPGITK